MARTTMKKSSKKTARKKEFSFGSAHIVNDPSKPIQKAGIKSVNLTLSFQESLKLHVALQAAVLELNSFDRNTAKGKNKGVSLCYYPETNYITVNRVDIPKKYQNVKGRANCTTCGRVKLCHLSEGIGRLVGYVIPIPGITKEPASGQRTQDGNRNFNTDIT